jgi:hypothetical protein
MVRDEESGKVASMIGTDSRSVTMRIADIQAEIDDIDDALIRPRIGGPGLLLKWEC